MRDNWTDEQITIVLYEYCRRPFGQFNGTKQFVIDLGNLLGRSPGAFCSKGRIAKDFFFGKPQDVDEATMSFIMGFDHKQMIMPKRFLPDRDLQAQHYEKFTKIAI